MSRLEASFGQIGKDQEPIDLSREDHEKAFQKDMGNWSEKMSQDTGMYSYGYVDIESVKANPYGVTYLNGLLLSIFFQFGERDSVRDLYIEQ